MQKSIDKRLVDYLDRVHALFPKVDFLRLHVQLNRFKFGREGFSVYVHFGEFSRVFGSFEELENWMEKKNLLFRQFK